MNIIMLYCLISLEYSVLQENCHVYCLMNYRREHITSSILSFVLTTDAKVLLSLLISEYLHKEASNASATPYGSEASNASYTLLIPS